MTRPTTAPLLALALLSIFGGTASAGILNPLGLNPGDQYRIAFVTSGTRNALSSNIADYNVFVQGQANAGSETSKLSTNWTAIASTATVSALTNTSTAGADPIPIYLVNGTDRIANSYADLWDGTLANSLSLNEGGASQSSIVWTGTQSDGSIDTFGHLGPLVTTAIRGASTATDSTWIADTVSSISNAHHLYGISDVQTIAPAAVPEPSSLLMMGVGGVGLLMQRRRKKQMQAHCHAG